ncbi:hypothetical protein HMPREF9225_1642 [Peptoniphilus duerdenii ATCC BAA-1640]|uniref:Uncharacterized protein n=1 Tax=Peptoniphilus duerdenii ATCC BAA-1640 TaxID=862517 RepID=E0NNA3_9FIRM|nr:hypothetical protein [Peptoniphilus duerdenii]EFM24776.1 hypothetical protein HMPREF9225_1642 [Peptoniphilus duerdenii ATCC BAA-1640]
MAEKKTQSDKYTKEAILKSEKLRWNRDVLSVLLESGKEYTLDEVEKIVQDFNKREVK